MGTIDSVKHIERCLKLGTIEVVETSYGWQVKGDTYPVKDYLKKEFDAHWNKDAKAWDIVIMDCYSDGRNHYHYTLLNEACRQEEQEQEEQEEQEQEEQEREEQEREEQEREETIECTPCATYSVQVIDNDGNTVCHLYTTTYPGHASQFFDDCIEGFSAYDKALALVENGEIIDWYAPSSAFTYMYNRLMNS